MAKITKIYNQSWQLEHSIREDGSRRVVYDTKDIPTHEIWSEGQREKVYTLPWREPVGEIRRDGDKMKIYDSHGEPKGEIKREGNILRIYNEHGTLVDTKILVEEEYL